MERIKKVNISKIVESVYSTLTRQTHIKFGLERTISDNFNEDFIRAYLYGFIKINLNATENRNGTLNFASKEDRIKYDSLFNFYSNKNSVDSVFYKDLSGLDSSLFEDGIISVRTLNIPFTKEDEERFIETINY